MKAWLITWENAGEHAKVLDKIAGLLNPRWPATRVAHVVEFLYARARYNIQEMAHQYAKFGCSRPYKAEIGPWEIVSCGHDPYLEARKVTNLEVVVDPATEMETISWTEPARRAVLTGELKAAEAQFSYTRSITGPVSDRVVRESSLREMAFELDSLLKGMPHRNSAELLERAMEFGPTDLVISRP